MPLWQHILVGTRMFDLFDTAAQQARPDAGVVVDKELVRYLKQREAADRTDSWEPRGRGRGRGPRSPYRPPPRPDVLARLDSEGLLPAITFIFSRAGCDAALAQCSALAPGPVEPRRVRPRSTRSSRGTPANCRAATSRCSATGNGARPCTADWPPTMRACCRRSGTPSRNCSSRAWCEAVFATETLALGINMPARTVVLERLVKYNGETHAALTPGEYTQLTGRAGRRGIDVEGHAVVIWHPGLDADRGGGLGLDADLPAALVVPARLQHDDQPDRPAGRDGIAGVAGAVLRAVPGRPLGRRTGAGHRAQRGPARRVAGQAGRGGQRVPGVHLAARTDPRAGADIGTPGPRRTGAGPRWRRWGRCGAATSSPSRPGAGRGWRWCSSRTPTPAIRGRSSSPRTSGRAASRSPTSRRPREALGRMRLPKHVDHRTARSRRDLASALRSTGITAPRGRARRGTATGPVRTANWRRCAARLRSHPCHSWPDREQLARVGERYNRVLRETDSMRQKVAATTNSLARTFDRIVSLLTERGYIARDADGVAVTDAGRSLARIYTESDLLVAECLRDGAWRGLGPAELAAVVSAVVYESANRGGPAHGGGADGTDPAGDRRDGAAVERTAQRRGPAQASADPRTRPRVRHRRLEVGARGGAGRGIDRRGRQGRRAVGG